MQDLIAHNIFSELVVLLLIAALVGALLVRFRQPLVMGFIAVGILAGPSGFHWIHSSDQIHALSEMGLALLLFVVGLRLDIHLIRAMGAAAVIAGLGQVLLTSCVAFLLLLALGFPPITCLYVGLALTLSSTIIIVKLLSDNRETDALHGRLTLGILIVQDLVVVVAMIALSAISRPAGNHPLLDVLTIIGKGAALLGGVWFVTAFAWPRLLKLLARSTELLVLFAIAWALMLALLGDMLGFGKEVGAFLAGISLASTEFREIIGAKLVSLRDFLLIFFFIELGSQLDIGSLGAQVGVSILLALFVLVCKPLIVMILMAVMGYRKRTGFLTGVHLAQISEFSLILVAMGAAAGHMASGTVGMVTFVGLLTIGLSGYLLQSVQGIYERIAPHLGLFEKKVRYREDTVTQVDEGAGVDIILFGIGRYGTSIAEQMQLRGRKVLGVDFDPQAVRSWQARGWRAVFGDVEDPDFAESLPLAHARWVVSSIRDMQHTQAFMRAVRHAGYTGNLAITVDHAEEGERMLTADAGLVLVPFSDAASQAADLLFLTEERIARETMDHFIETIAGHYIVCGYGRMGQQIVQDFRHHAVPFVVVEDNPEQLPRLREEQIPHVVGRACLDEILLHAGIQRAKGVIAVAASDEENVFIVLTARGLNERLMIVARSIRVENEDKLRRAGADRVMSPYILGGRRMASAVTRPDVMEFIDLVIHDEQFMTDVGSIRVEQEPVSKRLTLHDLDFWQACGVTVLAIRRVGEPILANPGPDVTLHEGDELMVMGSHEQIASAQQHLTSHLSAPGKTVVSHAAF